MLESLSSIFGTAQMSLGRLSNSSDTSTGGIDVQIGRSNDAQIVHIPQSIIKSCPPLEDLLVPGCRIANTDVVVFATIIKHLEYSSILGTWRFNAPDHLQDLIGDNDALLNLAKAWHVCDMLEMTGLQNKLLGIYRGHYLQCLKNHIRLPLDPEPFVYLRDNIGNHTNAETFMVDFHAGLMQNDSKFEPIVISSLPDDIAINIRDRWQQLSGQVRKDSLPPGLGYDRIASGISHYKVSKNDNTQHSTMQVQQLCARSNSKWCELSLCLHPQHKTSSNVSSSFTPGSNGRHTSRLPTRKYRSTNCSCGKISTATSGHPGLSDRTTLGAKHILTDPFVQSISRQRLGISRPVSPTEVPSMPKTPKHGYRPPVIPIRRSEAPQLQDPRQSRTPPTYGLLRQAPFMPSSPARIRQSHDMDDSETDDESVYNLFVSNSAPDSPWLDAQSSPSGSRQVKPILGILDFAA